MPASWVIASKAGEGWRSFGKKGLEGGGGENKMFNSAHKIRPSSQPVNLAAGAHRLSPWPVCVSLCFLDGRRGRELEPRTVLGKSSGRTPFPFRKKAKLAQLQVDSKSSVVGKALPVEWKEDFWQLAEREKEGGKERKTARQVLISWRKKVGKNCCFKPHPPPSPQLPVFILALLKQKGWVPSQWPDLSAVFALCQCFLKRQWFLSFLSWIHWKPGKC